MKASSVNPLESTPSFKGKKSKSILYDNPEIQIYKKSSKLEEYSTKKLSELEFRTKGDEFVTEVVEANEMKNTLFLIEQQEKKLQLQRQQLRKRSEIALSPYRKSSDIALSPYKSPSFATIKKEEINFETQKGFKIIKKTEEKVDTRPPFRLNSNKIVDRMVTSRMKNLKIELNDYDSSNNRFDYNVKKAPENNLIPKSKNENKIELNFSTKKAVNDPLNSKQRDSSQPRAPIITTMQAKEKTEKTAYETRNFARSDMKSNLYPTGFQTPTNITNFTTSNVNRAEKNKFSTVKLTSAELNVMREKLNICEPKVESEYFDYNTEKTAELSTDEKAMYGTREPKDYTKVKLLGKGGTAVVWLCKNNAGEFFAVKQISKRTSDNRYNSNEQASLCAQRENSILKTLHLSNDKITKSMVIGVREYIEDNNDIWIVFEKGGSSISGLIFKLKGEFLNGERIYSIKKGFFLKFLFDDINNLKIFIRKMLKFIEFLNTNGIVHCDLKPENILLEFDPNNIKTDAYSVNQLFSKIRIIDFGSAFFIDSPQNFSSNTPEYMSPEINENMDKIGSRPELNYFLQNLKSYPWAIDIWSLGVTILEMALSCPLWMNYKAKVTVKDKVIFKTGLFGVQSRDGSKIYSKQVEVANNVGKLLQDSLIKDENDIALLADLVSQMLDLNYKKRICPTKALEHPFLKAKKNDL